MAACFGPLMMCVRTADVPCAYALLRLNSMRRRTSSWLQNASSLAQESSAPAREPEWLRLRSQVCPLSMWVWMSLNVGQHIPPSASTTRTSLGGSRVPAGEMSSTFPSQITMSTRTSPSWSAWRPSPSTPDTVHNGTCALTSTNESVPSGGTVGIQRDHDAAWGASPTQADAEACESERRGKNRYGVPERKPSPRHLALLRDASIHPQFKRGRRTKQVIDQRWMWDRDVDKRAVGFSTRFVRRAVSLSDFLSHRPSLWPLLIFSCIPLFWADTSGARPPAIVPALPRACRAKFLSHYCGAEPPSSCAEPQDRMAGGDGSVYVLTQTDFVLLALLAFVCLYMIPRRVYRWVRGGGGRSEDKGNKDA